MTVLTCIKLLKDLRDNLKLSAYLIIVNPLFDGI